MQISIISKDLPRGGKTTHLSARAKKTPQNTAEKRKNARISSLKPLPTSGLLRMRMTATPSSKGAHSPGQMAKASDTNAPSPDPRQELRQHNKKSMA